MLYPDLDHALDKIESKCMPRLIALFDHSHVCCENHESKLEKNFSAEPARLDRAKIMLDASGMKPIKNGIGGLTELGRPESSLAGSPQPLEPPTPPEETRSPTCPEPRLLRLHNAHS